MYIGRFLHCSQRDKHEKPVDCVDAWLRFGIFNWAKRIWHSLFCGFGGDKRQIIKPLKLVGKSNFGKVLWTCIWDWTMGDFVNLKNLQFRLLLICPASHIMDWYQFYHKWDWYSAIILEKNIESLTFDIQQLYLKRILNHWRLTSKNLNYTSNLSVHPHFRYKKLYFCQN